MPRIRKKTTNRLKTNDRAKVLKKVKETKRKTAKAAKKNPQWKSKHKKDPGIPNDFPYKDQLLAEVAEQRRIAAEQKQLRKDEKKGGQAKQKNADNEDESGSGSEAEVEDAGEVPVLKGLNVGIDGIASLSAKLMKGELRHREVAPVVEEEEEEDEVPVLINRDLPTLQSVLDAADIIVEVLDARDPLSFRSKHVEELAATKKVIFVLNKIDTCPREALVSWTAHLRTEHPTFLFRSATAFLPAGPVMIDPKVKVKGKGKGKIPSEDGVGVDSILACFTKLIAEKKKEGESDAPFTVAVVGMTNVGKSSFINSLLGKRALPVYTRASSSRGPTTTTLPQEVTLEVPQPTLVTPKKSDKEVKIPVRIIDTPGLSWVADEEEDNIEDTRSCDILLRSKGRIDRLKDPIPPIAHIVSRANNEDLMLLYSLPAFSKNDPTAFLSGVARSNQLVKKKGDLDLTGAARIVLNDWNTGKFGRYTVPPANIVTARSSEADIFTNDEAILADIPMKKEMRKTAGLVRFAAGKVETRKAAVELPWAGMEEDGDSEVDDDEGENVMEVDEDADGDHEGGSEEDEEESVDNEEEDEEESLPPPISNKQKRKRVAEPVSAPPSKKVAFAPPPKSSKQARKEGSLKGKAKATGKEEKPVSKKSAAPPKPTTTDKISASNKGTSGPTKLLPAAKKVKQDKVANVAAKKKGSASAAAAGGKNEEAYDFGKFF